MGDVSNRLHREIEAAKALRANLADIIGDDEEFAADVIEGETNLHSAIHAAVSRLLDDEGAMNGIDGMVEILESRRHRIKARITNTKTALAAALEQAGLKKFEHAAVTLSIRPVAPSVVVTDEAVIPSAYFKAADPKLDRKALLAALKSKQDVPGATLSNGGTCIAFSWS